METSSGAILTFTVIHVSQAGSSTAMEVYGCEQVIKELQDYGVQIKVLGTDRSMTVEKLLSSTFPGIEHQFDVYHVEKGIRKKLMNKAKERGGYGLFAWVKAVINHLWYCCQNCNEDPALLKEKWMSIIYHVTNTHEWEYFDNFQKCDHEVLIDEAARKKKWLVAGSTEHEGLKKVVLQPKLISDIGKLNLAIHTGSLECFHSLINKYCPKRQSFSYKGMVARTELAVLDHNFNLGRPQAKRSDGTLCNKSVFPKRTKDWILKAIYERKSHEWRQDLVKQVIAVRNQTLQETPEDIPVPSDIPKNIATIEKPPFTTLLEKQQSRFARKEKQLLNCQHVRFMVAFILSICFWILFPDGSHHT
jgi:hypothetical protein